MVLSASLVLALAIFFILSLAFFLFYQRLPLPSFAFWPVSSFPVFEGSP